MHAEPTTFGLKLATWYSEMKAAISSVSSMRLLAWELQDFSGAVGNFATSHLIFVENTSAINWVSVLKKSLHRSFSHSSAEYLQPS